MEPKRGSREARANEFFPQTQWSVILRARDESTVALNTLCEKYRKPLLIWLQCRQHEFCPLEPEDLVNGFFACKLQERFLKTVKPGQGKFRSFVLECLRNYAISERRKATAGKRGGGESPQAIDETTEDGQAIIEPVSTDPAANAAYDRAWGHAILANAISRLEAELTRAGHLSLWHALQPHLYDEQEAPGYDQIAKALSISKNALYTAAHRIRKRLRELIHDELKETVATKEDFEEERKRFLELFSAPHWPGASL